MTIKETRAKLIEVINQSGLSIDVIELLLENLFAMVHQQAEVAYSNMDAAEEKQEQAPKKETGKKSK